MAPVKCAGSDMTLTLAGAVGVRADDDHAYECRHEWNRGDQAKTHAGETGGVLQDFGKPQKHAVGHQGVRK